MLPPKRTTLLVVFLVFLQMQILEDMWYVSVNCMTCVFFGVARMQLTVRVNPHVSGDYAP